MPSPGSSNSSRSGAIGPQTVNMHSAEGFPSKHWGPGLWNFIHICALNLRRNPTVEDSAGYYDFFNGLRFVLPCGICRREYRKLIAKGRPLALRPELFNDRKTAFEWTVKMHYAVSSRLGHPNSKNMSKDWGEHYEKMRFAGPYRNWTGKLPTAQNLQNFVATSSPVVVFIAPVAYKGWKYNKKRLSEVKDILLRKFKNRIRYVAVDQVHYTKITGNALPPGTFVLYQHGAVQAQIAHFDELLYELRRIVDASGVQK